MEDYSADEVQAALAPLASLIGKSEKSQQKVAPGTWQHAMLRDNLHALHIAVALITDAPEPHATKRDELEEALRALASMRGRTEKAGAKFTAGTSHHTLVRNRLNALRIAEALVRAELDRG